MLERRSLFSTVVVGGRSLVVVVAGWRLYGLFSPLGGMLVIYNGSEIKFQKIKLLGDAYDDILRSYVSTCSGATLFIPTAAVSRITDDAQVDRRKYLSHGLRAYPPAVSAAHSLQLCRMHALRMRKTYFFLYKYYLTSWSSFMWSASRALFYCLLTAQELRFAAANHIDGFAHLSSLTVPYITDADCSCHGQSASKAAYCPDGTPHCCDPSTDGCDGCGWGPGSYVDPTDPTSACYRSSCGAGYSTGVCIGSGPSLPPTASEGGPCFPSSSTVAKADGTIVRLDALEEGDEIVASTMEGTFTTDTVSLLSIAKPEAVTSFITLTTATNHTVTLTTGHRVPVGAACCTTLKLARSVTVGDTVWAVHAGATVGTTVVAKASTTAHGLHSPVLTHGGFPIVDGVVTSFDSIEMVTLARHGLSPLISACKATGMCDKFRYMFLHEVLEYVHTK